MHAVVLAAGAGSRLGQLTHERPKPCLVVAGKPLLAWTLEFARRASATTITVVAGYHAELVTSLARSCGVDEVVHNPAWEGGGNLGSLAAARAAGALRFPLLVMNADHVYREGIARRVLDEAGRATEVTAFVDRDRTLGADDMKVRLDQAGAVAAIDKKLPRWDVGYVGVTLVPAAAAERYLAACDATREALGEAAHVEAVLARLAVGATPPRVADVSGVGWYEVDDASDLRRAEAALAEPQRSSR